MHLHAVASCTQSWTFSSPDAHSFNIHILRCACKQMTHCALSNERHRSCHLASAEIVHEPVISQYWHCSCCELKHGGLRTSPYCWCSKDARPQPWGLQSASSHHEASGSKSSIVPTAVGHDAYAQACRCTDCTALFKALGCPCISVIPSLFSYTPSTTTNEAGEACIAPPSASTLSCTMPFLGQAWTGRE